MLKFIAKRAANYVVMLYVAISFTYFMASAFMTPRSNYESRTPRPPQASIERTLDLANINDHTSVFVRYWHWLTNIVTKWDWGLSPSLESVNKALAPRILASTELVTLSTVLSIVLGVALGIYTAQRQYHWQDRLFSTLATFFLVIPSAVLALMIVLIAITVNDAAGFRIFYVTGLSSYSGDNLLLRFGDFLQHIILPTISLTSTCCSLPPASRSSHGSSKKPTLRQARKAAKYCRSTPSSLCLSLSSTRYSATFRNRKRKKPSKRSPK